MLCLIYSKNDVLMGKSYCSKEEDFTQYFNEGYYIKILGSKKKHYSFNDILKTVNSIEYQSHVFIEE